MTGGANFQAPAGGAMMQPMMGGMQMVCKLIQYLLHVDSFHC